MDGGGGRSWRVPAGERSKEEKIRKQHRALFIYFEVEGQARKRKCQPWRANYMVPPVTVLAACHRCGIQTPSLGGTLYWERRSPIGGPHPKIRNWQPALILSSTNLIKRGKPRANGTMETPESCAQGKMVVGKDRGQLVTRVLVVGVTRCHQAIAKSTILSQANGQLQHAAVF